ncbi:uncharacterized protein [Anabrus simplex]|uniref:uncharacterized protein n=1 Tax=Anabrus simplex TaxID=316456 RepID=UPI0035A2C781
MGEINTKLGMNSMNEAERINCLRWWGHVRRIEEDRLSRIIMDSAMEEWTDSGYELRYSVTRFAIHGFQRKTYHVPDLQYVCSDPSTVKAGSFPKDPVRRNKWIAFANKGDWKPTSRSVLCSKHFSQDCFDKTSSSVIRLKPQAIPTLLVERRKYVRSHNPEFVIPVGSDPDASELSKSEDGTHFSEQPPVEGNSQVSESLPVVKPASPILDVLRKETRCSSDGTVIPPDGTVTTPNEIGAQKTICYVVETQDLTLKRLRQLKKDKPMLKKTLKDKPVTALRPILPKGIIEVPSANLQNCLGLTASQSNEQIIKEPIELREAKNYCENPKYLHTYIQWNQSLEVQEIKQKCKTLETENRFLRENLNALETVIKCKDAALQNTRTLVEALRRESAQKEEILQKLTKMLSSIFSKTELQILNCRDIDQLTKLQKINSVS